MKNKSLAVCSSAALFAGASMLMTGCVFWEEEQPTYRPQPAVQQPVATPEDEIFVPPVSNVPEKGDETAAKNEVPEKGDEPVMKNETPEKGDPAARSTSEQTYIVKKGDNYTRIAGIYGIRVSDLIAANSNIPPMKLRPGQKITIPSGAREVKADTSAPVKNTGAKNAGRKHIAREAVPADGIYTVKKGDSLYKIAVRFGVRSADIAAANNMSITKTLQPGQKLTIPKPGETVSAPAADTGVTQPAPTDPTAAPVADPASADTLPPPVDDPTALPTVEPPAADTTAAPAIPDTPVTDAAPVTDTAAPAPALPATDTVLPYAVKIDTDTTLEEIGKKYGCGVSELKKLNPAIPDDGIVKAGTSVNLP